MAQPDVQSSGFLERVRRSIDGTPIEATSGVAVPLQASIQLGRQKRSADLSYSDASNFLPGALPSGWSGPVYAAEYVEGRVRRLAFQRCRSLAPVLAATHAWLLEGVSALDLPAIARGIEIAVDYVRAYEAGPEAFAAHRWSELFTELNTPTRVLSRWEHQLRAVVSVGRQDPTLSRLRPYIGIGRLGVVAPFAAESKLPVIMPSAAGPFVFTLVNFRTGEVFATGSAAEVVEALARKAALAAADELGAT